MGYSMTGASKKQFGAGSQGKGDGTGAMAQRAGAGEPGPFESKQKAEMKMSPSTVPMLQIRNTDAGAWCVHAQFPDGSFEDIGGFKTENDANEWIAHELQQWLDQRKDNSNVRQA
jgi:hypothetical protein